MCAWEIDVRGDALSEAWASPTTPRLKILEIQSAPTWIIFRLKLLEIQPDRLLEYSNTQAAALLAGRPFLDGSVFLEFPAEWLFDSYGSLPTNLRLGAHRLPRPCTGCPVHE